MEFKNPQALLLAVKTFNPMSVKCHLHPATAETLLRELYSEQNLEHDDFDYFVNELSSNLFHLETKSQEIANVVYCYLFGIVDIDEKTTDHGWLIENNELTKCELHHVSNEIDALVLIAKQVIDDRK